MNDDAQAEQNEEAAAGYFLTARERARPPIANAARILATGGRGCILHTFARVDPEATATSCEPGTDHAPPINNRGGAGLPAGVDKFYSLREMPVFGKNKEE